MAEMKMICAVHRSRRNPGAYLYVEHQDGMSRVPETLLRELGGFERAMTLVLEPGRRLAQIDAQELMQRIRSEGFYLQMPPLPESLASRHNTPPC